jgi:hypothetical protein
MGNLISISKKECEIARKTSMISASATSDQNMILTMAEKQIDCDDHPLAKSDLIAILIQIRDGTVKPLYQ